MHTYMAVRIYKPTGAGTSFLQCNQSVIKKEQGMEKQLFDKNFIVINTKDR